MILSKKLIKTIINLFTILAIYTCIHAQDNSSEQFSGDLFGTGGQVSLTGKDAMEIKNGSIHTSNNV